MISRVDTHRDVCKYWPKYRILSHTPRRETKCIGHTYTGMKARLDDGNLKPYLHMIHSFRTQSQFYISCPSLHSYVCCGRLMYCIHSSAKLWTGAFIHVSYSKGLQDSVVVYIYVRHVAYLHTVHSLAFDNTYTVSAFTCISNFL